MLDFQLFRVKVYPPSQQNLFEVMTPQQLLAETIEQHPSIELRKNTFWHIGNISFLDDDGGLYFRFGRTTKSKLELFRDGNFIDAEFQSSPYTHIILDITTEICAIAKKSKLAPSVGGIATQFIRLLKRSGYATTREIDFEISPINDPHEFISYIQHAYEISSFWMTFTRPNAFDSHKDFIKPMEKLLTETAGESGKTEVKGENLNSDTLENLTRSAAATGDNAGAIMKLEEGQRRVKKQLRGNPVIINKEHVDDAESRKALLHALRERYRSIRGNES